MKKLTQNVLTFLAIWGLTASLVYAQIPSPRPSPMVKVEQEFGLGTVTLDYSRPSAKGRKVFGDLVPFGQVWRTGANGATKITFTDAVKVEGNAVAAGTYALYTIPGESEWTVMLYSDLSLGGNVAGYDQTKEAVRVSVKSSHIAFSVETFTIFMDELRDNSASLVLVWEETMVSIKLETDVDAKVMAAINKVMKGVSANDYYNAAIYYYNTDRNINQAMEWMAKAEAEMGDRYWVQTWYARVLAKAGKTKEAMAASQKAKKLAQEAKNNDYVKINDELMAELKKK
ncbi:MAG: DUF2911 domain-containing protein [Bacteroidia bacterium]